MTGTASHLPDRFEPAGIGRGNLADEAEVRVGLLLARAKDVTIAAGEPNGSLAMRSDGGNQRFVDAARKNHQRGIPRLGIGDAQAGDELALLAHQRQGARQLDAAAMDHRDLVSVGDQIGDGLAAAVQNLLGLQGPHRPV